MRLANRRRWLIIFELSDASVAQLVEHHLAKVNVEGSNPFARSTSFPLFSMLSFNPVVVYSCCMAAAHMDVAALNRECDVHVSVSPHWNGVELGELPKDKFTPLYVVWWASRDRTRKPGTGGAEVELFLPTKDLIQLTVNEPKYILRPPLVFTNLSTLFPDKAEIITNKPSKVIILDGSKFNTL